MQMKSLSFLKSLFLFQFTIVQITKAQSSQTTLWPCKQWQHKARALGTRSTSNQIMCQSRCKTSTSQCVAFVFEPGQGSKSCRLYGAFSRNSPEVNFLAGGTICSNKITGDPPVINAEGCEQKPGVKGTRAKKALKVKSLDECKSKCKGNTCDNVLYRYSPADNAFYCDFFKAGGATELRYFAGEVLCPKKDELGAMVHTGSESTFSSTDAAIEVDGRRWFCDQWHYPGWILSTAWQSTKAACMRGCTGRCSAVIISPRKNDFKCVFLAQDSSSSTNLLEAGSTVCVTTLPSFPPQVIKNAPSSCMLLPFKRGMPIGMIMAVVNVAACQHRCFSAPKFGLQCDWALVYNDPKMNALICDFYATNPPWDMKYFAGEIACPPVRLSPNEPLYAYTEPFPPKDCTPDQVFYGRISYYELATIAFCFKLCAGDPDCSHVGVRPKFDNRIDCARVYENSNQDFTKIYVQHLTICKIRSLAPTEKAICRQYDLTGKDDVWSMDAKNSDECHARCFKFCEFYIFDPDAGKCFFYRRNNVGKPEATPIYSPGQVLCSILKTIQEPVIVDKSCPQIDISGRRGSKVEVKSMTECYALCEDDSHCSHALAYQANSSSPIFCTKFQAHMTKGEKLKYYGNESICPRRTPPKKKELTCARFEFHGGPVASLLVSSIEECEKRCTDFCDVFSFLKEPRKNVNCFHYDSWGIQRAKNSRKKSDLTLLYFDQTLCSRNYVGRIPTIPRDVCTEVTKVMGDRFKVEDYGSADLCMLLCELIDRCTHAIFRPGSCTLVSESIDELQWTSEESVCPRKGSRPKVRGSAPKGCRRGAYFGITIDSLTVQSNDECWETCQRTSRCSGIVYNVIPEPFNCDIYYLYSNRETPPSRETAIFLEDGEYMCASSYYIYDS